MAWLNEDEEQEEARLAVFAGWACWRGGHRRDCPRGQIHSEDFDDEDDDDVAPPTPGPEVQGLGNP